jgi:hypothetical protein
MGPEGARVAPPPLDPFRASVRPDRRSGATGFQMGQKGRQVDFQKSKKKDRVLPSPSSLAPP